jgi:hypothetical protein
MSELSPELRELVLATRSANLATEADAARVLVALRARLGDAAVFGIDATQAVESGTSSGFAFQKVLALSITGLAVLGGLWFATAHRVDASRALHSFPGDSVTSTASMALAPSALSSSAPAVPKTDSLAAVTDTNETPTLVGARLVASHNGKDRLAEEVALLARAESAIHNGNPSVALQVLNEHERRFRNGQLTEERIAARIQALCALGRATEADAQLARLAPKSLHGPRARQACVAQRVN